MIDATFCTLEHNAVVTQHLTSSHMRRNKILRNQETLISETEPPHDKTNKMAYARSEGSDQPGHPPRLIRVFAVRMKKS